MPDELAALLERVEAGDLPEGVAVLRRRRRISRKGWGLIGFGGAFAAPAAAWIALVEVVPPLALFGLTTGALLSAIAVATDLRRPAPTYLLVSPSFVAHVGDPLGVQWAGAWELSGVTDHPRTHASGGYGGGGVAQAPSLELLFKDGSSEQVFVDPQLSAEDLAAWRRTCEEVLAIG